MFVKKIASLHSATTFWSREVPDFGHLLQSEVPERFGSTTGGGGVPNRSFEGANRWSFTNQRSNEAKHVLKRQVPAMAGEHAEIYVVIPST